MILVKTTECSNYVPWVSVPNKATGADGVKLAVLRKSLANLAFI
jgi:hypothetical protein